MRTLATLGYTSIALITLAGCGSKPSPRAGAEPSSASATRPVSSKPSLSGLSVDDVLGWRDTYGDLLGKPREAAIERFGPAEEDEGTNSLRWGPSPKTGDRSVRVLFLSAQKGAIVEGVKVYARPTESLDPIEILKRAPMFEFSSGTYTDTLVNYFTAKTKDGRNIFQFDVAEGGVKFCAMAFTRK